MVDTQNYLENSGYPFSPSFLAIKNADDIKL